MWVLSIAAISKFHPQLLPPVDRGGGVPRVFVPVARRLARAKVIFNHASNHCHRPRPTLSQPANASPQSPAQKERAGGGAVRGGDGRDLFSMHAAIVPRLRNVGVASARRRIKILVLDKTCTFLFMNLASRVDLLPANLPCHACAGSDAGPPLRLTICVLRAFIFPHPCPTA